MRPKKECETSEISKDSPQKQPLEAWFTPLLYLRGRGMPQSAQPLPGHSRTSVPSLALQSLLFKPLQSWARLDLLLERFRGPSAFQLPQLTLEACTVEECPGCEGKDQ